MDPASSRKHESVETVRHGEGVHDTRGWVEAQDSLGMLPEEDAYRCGVLQVVDLRDDQSARGREHTEEDEEAHMVVQR